jgi:hypothetical protein
VTIDFLPTLEHCAMPLIIGNPTPHFYKFYLQLTPDNFFMKNPRKRVRVNGAVGFVDPPSDEEIEVNINATSNSVTGEVKYDYSTSSPVKRVKKASTSILQDDHATPPESAPASVKNTLKESSEQSDPKEEQKRKQVRVYTTLDYPTDSLLYLIGGLGYDGDL